MNNKKHRRSNLLAFHARLTPDQLALINQISETRRLDNQSLAIRQIIDEWAELKKEVELTPPTPKDQ